MDCDIRFSGLFEFYLTLGSSSLSSDFDKTMCSTHEFRELQPGAYFGLQPDSRNIAEFQT